MTFEFPTRSTKPEAITFAALPSGSPDQLTCAAWRHEAFLKDDGYSLADSLAQLEAVSADPGEAALTARWHGALAGLALLVRAELPPAHDLTPWLASLFVAPLFRRRGVARALIGGIEMEARARGHRRVHLYTNSAEGLYRRCGWFQLELQEPGAEHLLLMAKDI